ncbi:DUF1990 domain-containing protein [Dactylosporangium fulvum]|uniref:DUF1990 domain-containing protein n=1 Tax=Dactylosporangium fulvum TaxID=53359 RepID=A0ABY5W1C3_9ACTN|nr:DUF1990 domain-containing protein [Dactylosporangium fulvum]UWP83725.1 DUF1990 domain-containing protein [Dactylosporangium fulvum]
MTVTYPEVGATREGPMPPGYLHVTRRVRLGSGPDVFAAAKAGLAHWQPQRGAGLRVRTDAETAGPGVEFATGIGIGPLRLWVPCLIVWVVDEPDRYGFGFGTLPGHVETGEESFLLSTDGAGDVWFDIRAFSRPAKWWVKLGNPVAKLVQSKVTDRYAAAMQRGPLP